MQKYNAKYFKENLPEWKRKKDPILSKFFYRKVSFFVSGFFANRGTGANTVSNISTVIGIIACVFMVIPQYWCGIVSAILVNTWLIFDCADGNIARSVKAQPFGEFVDACSSYILCGLLFNAMGLRVFLTGDYVLPIPAVYLTFLGALASSFDSLMRLIYQKYIVVSRDWNVEGKVALDGSNAGKIDKIRIRIDQELNLGGILPLAILLGAILRCLDIVIVLWTIYFLAVFTASTCYLIHKAGKFAKQEASNAKND